MAGNLVMAFDYGTTKIGVAIGQSITGTATAIATVGARDGVPDWDAIAKLVHEWQPSSFVVGLPVNMDGSDSDMSARAEKFARQLSGRFGTSAETMDERLTSREANGYANDGESIDAIAAKLILESWFRKT